MNESPNYHSTLTELLYIIADESDVDVDIPPLIAIFSFTLYPDPTANADSLRYPPIPVVKLKLPTPYG